MAFVLGSAYRGAILSFLTVSVVNDPYETFEDLQRFEGKIGSLFDVLTRRISSSEEEVFQNLATKLVPYSEIRKNYNELVREGKLALGDSRRSLEYQLRENFVDRYER